jgi:hypothetical protein
MVRIHETFFHISGLRHTVPVPIQGLGIVNQHTQLLAALPAEQPLTDLNELFPVAR